MRKLKSYDDAIVYTFRENAVRSAILIDDSFPTFQDLLNPDIDAKMIYADYSIALNLYKSFHQKKILCDIENNIDNTTEGFIDKIRKSDLVILDWNLKPEDDGENALRILEELSSSEHFNLVVIYTRDTKLNRIWTRTALRLRGGWHAKERMVENFSLPESYSEIFNDIDSGKIEELFSDEVLNLYLETCNSKKNGGRAVLKKLGTELQSILQNAGVDRENYACFTEILIHDFVIRKFTPSLDRDNFLIQGKPEEDSRFLLCGSVFIALMVKKDQDSENTEDIFSCLDTALKNWRPNLLQLLISEIQNDLEQKSYASIQEFMPKDALQVGWIYHTRLSEKKDSEISNAALTLSNRLIDKLKTTISKGISDKESEFYKFSEQAASLLFEEKSLASLSVFEASKIVSKIAKTLTEHEVLHALNEYLSSDVFIGGNPTTGTVFFAEVESKKEWYVCVSPACDMEIRETKSETATENQPKLKWQEVLHPFKPMNLLRLQEVSAESALKRAEDGVVIFVMVVDKPYYLSVVDLSNNQPRPLTVFLSEISNGDIFKVNLPKYLDNAISFVEVELHAHRQLRPEYAARILHLAGAYQSRVGVDFVKFPRE